MEKPEIIKGDTHTDSRGKISFVNDFDMSDVKRFYAIENAHTEVKRGWRGHRIEKRWFNAIAGSFSVKLVKIDDWLNPSSNLPIENFIISAINNEILYIPSGYASCIQAIETESRLIVFANFDIANAPNDDYLFREDYFESTYKLVTGS
ncbi:WxcM-like domain-containing protein [Pedobacter psychroterrae]|uniref:Sugar epimerase n=1 Tax=Pedobacter psychroterrae TaxID=2530453 RepID=A0A4V2MK40_9SPHI|nr:WxcM-like domain-containing protein [Pedobacter psychroterrae]TCC96806.1 sugar epimerase [Pedobacter psychroterrae]